MKLADAIERYIAQKRAGGCSFRDAERRFATFYRRVGNLELDQVTTHHVQQYLDSAIVTTATWRNNYFRLLRFFEYWILREAMPELVLPPVKRHVPQTYVPYVYTRAELRALLGAQHRHPDWELHNKLSEALISEPPRPMNELEIEVRCMNHSDGVGARHTHVDPTGLITAFSLSGAGPTEMDSLPSLAMRAAGSAFDRVDLSTTLRTVARALARPDIRAERIATLRQSIAAARYHVPSSEIANKVIGFLLKQRT